MKLVIPYKKMKTLIEAAEPMTTKPFLAFLYAGANRIGELVKYRHIKKERTRNEHGKLKWTGKYLFNYGYDIKASDVISYPNYIYIETPNFKNPKEELKKVIVSKVHEKWLTDIIEDYVDRHKGGVLFNFKRHKAMELVKKYLQTNSHNVRRSRLTHLSNIFGYDPWEIKATAGHSNLESSISYIQAQPHQLKRKLEHPVMPDEL